MKKGANNSYFGSIWEGISSLSKGIRLTFKHLFDARSTRKPIGVEHTDYFKQDTGIVTLEYPREAIPIPDNGRYRLHNEIDDCIVCDLCAKICPVNCIEIDVVKATEEIGKTSDGTTKRLYAARFDIDMAKCCYCGLCTTVCPTECLTMTKTYDYSEFDVRNMVYHFTDLSPEQAEQKKKLYEEKELAKAKAKAEADAAKKASASTTPATSVTPPTTIPPAITDPKTGDVPVVKKPAFKPVFKPGPVKPKPNPDQDKKE